MIKPDLLYKQLEKAIHDSIMRNVITRIVLKADPHDIEEILALIHPNYVVEYDVAEDGSYYIWGYAKGTLINKCDWRINILFEIPENEL